MDPFVSDQRTDLSEPFRTIIASVRSFSGMASLMNFDIFSRRELFTAHFTSVFPFPFQLFVSVCYVCCEGPFLCKRPVAMITFVRSFSGVFPHMDDHGRSGGYGEPAHFARHSLSSLNLGSVRRFNTRRVIVVDEGLDQIGGAELRSGRSFILGLLLSEEGV